MTTPPKPDPIATAQGLTEAVGELAAEVIRLRSSTKRNWYFIFFDVAVTVLLAAAGALGVHATSTAGQARSGQLALCKAGNEARAQQIQLWDHLLDTPPAPGAPKRTPAQEKQLAQFKAFIRADFAPRDCARLGQ